MFAVDNATKRITLHGGDTGVMHVNVTGYGFEANDRCLFTVKDRAGTEIMRRVYEIENGGFDVEFSNSDTDDLPAGTYYWDMRFIIGPEYDTQEQIFDGEGVSTPGSPFEMVILGTVGRV